MPTYFYHYLPYHYYHTYMIGEYIIDDFGNSVQVLDSVYGIEDYDD
jgi:hypothetical protein